MLSLRRLRPILSKALRYTGMSVLAVASLIFVGTALGVVLLRYTIITYEAPQYVAPAPFPIGVNPQTEVISENPQLDAYLEGDTGAVASTWQPKWLQKTFGFIANLPSLQQLAAPQSRVLVIQSGERKEEIAMNFGRLLSWDREERQTFMELVSGTTPVVADGKFIPAKYVVSRDATPDELAELVNERFSVEIMSRYPNEISDKVSLEEALTIASLLEREAYDFEDMRYISGVIWNRLFTDMKLQLDASLQYAKGSEVNQPWWPSVNPGDKYIASPYNTYTHSGLPPGPIANSSVEAVIAALNPRKTDCMFYFHDSTGAFHCTKTYEEHVALLQQYYGQGK